MRPVPVACECIVRSGVGAHFELLHDVIDQTHVPDTGLDEDQARRSVEPRRHHGLRIEFADHLEG